MAIREGPMKPMTRSGHCAYGPDHTKCRNPTCTCDCHKQPPAQQPQRRTRKKLI